jgi:hypothetical protein
VPASSSVCSLWRLAAACQHLRCGKARDQKNDARLPAAAGEEVQGRSI